jgi:hypothetical protein
MRVLQLSCTKNPLLIVQKSSRWKKKMVYILVADKSYKYNSGRRSHIIYIGTTGKGVHRPAASAVEKASDAFSELRGVKKIGVHVATCRGRKRIRTWEDLESALLATFRELYWGLPKYNKRRGSVDNIEDIHLFRLKALQKLILQFSD